MAMTPGDSRGVWRAGGGEVASIRLQPDQPVRHLAADYGLMGNRRKRLRGSQGYSRQWLGSVLLASILSLGALMPPAEAYPRPGETERISIGIGGAEPDGESYAPVITPNGRFVAFHSVASNLIKADGNGVGDVFLHDRIRHSTRRVSVSSAGAEANGASNFPYTGGHWTAISADGRYVAFLSAASNLVPGDTNEQIDVFVYDTKKRTTERASVSSDGAQASSWSNNLALSGNGRYVAFQSAASNLVPGDTNERVDVFLHDRKTGKTSRVSAPTDDSQADGGGSDPAINANGRFVAFVSSIPNAIGGSAGSQILLFDAKKKKTRMVSLASDGTEANARSDSPAISLNGRYVAFDSGASNLVPADSNYVYAVPFPGNPLAGSPDIFVRDVKKGTTERVSVSSEGVEANSQSFGATISANGRYVVFSSYGNNLVPGDSSSNTHLDAFVHDRKTRKTEVASVSATGDPAGGYSHTGQNPISSDGRYVAFDSRAPNILTGDTNGGAWSATDVFVRDRGPSEGPGELRVKRAGNAAVASGWATFSGRELTRKKDPRGDAAADGQDVTTLGADVVHASIIYRPENEDLLFRGELDSMPGPRMGAYPGILYRFGLTVGKRTFDIRAQRAGTTAVSPDPSDASKNADKWDYVTYFELFSCDPDCDLTAPVTLRGGIGTTGPEVLVSVPLDALNAKEGDRLVKLSASTAVGDARAGVITQLDELKLPDAKLPKSSVEIGAARKPGAKARHTTRAQLKNGTFRARLGLPPGTGAVSVRACLGRACGAAWRRV